MSNLKDVLNSKISFPIWFFTLLIVAFSATFVMMANDDDGGNGGDSVGGPPCFTNMVTDTVKTSCAVESWSDWTEETREETQSCYSKVTQTRTGTGFVSVFEETYDANGCTPSYSASSYKKACQVKEKRYVSVKVEDKPDCNGKIGEDIPGDEFTEGDLTTEIVEVTEGGEIIDRKTYRNSSQLLADAFNMELMADPQIVRQGNSTTLKWSARGVVSCSLSGNGDNWSYRVPSRRTADIIRGISGEEQSSPINEETVYTLSCARATGGNAEETVLIKVVPNWQEQ